MRGFDISADGFWRSFGAILLVAPAYGLTALAERQAMLSDAIAADDLSDAAFVIGKGLALCLDWVTLPILLALVARPLGFGRLYSGYIVARNWASVLAVAPFGLVALAYLIGFFSPGFADFLMVALLIVVLRYNYIIARRALDASPGFAGGLVVADFLLSLIIAGTINALFGI
jgi:hypothetical protein